MFRISILSITIFSFILLFFPGDSESYERSCYSVQIAAHKALSGADKHVQQLREKGYDAFHKKVNIPGKGEWYRIFIGRLEKKAEAGNLAGELKADGITEYWVIQEIKDVIRIGVVDSGKIIRDSNSGKDAQRKYLDILEKKRAVFNARQKEVIEQENADKRGFDGNDKKISRERRELIQLKASLEKELQTINEEIKAALLKEIKEVLKAYSEKEGFEMLLEEKSAVIIDESVDVTEKVIEFYNTQKLFD